MAIPGTTTAKGASGKTIFKFIQYAFVASQVADAGHVRDLHFDFGVEWACSAAARVPPRRLSPMHPLLRLPALCRFLFTRRFLMLRGAACGSGVGSAFPSSSATTSWCSSPFRGSTSTRASDVSSWAWSTHPGAGCFVAHSHCLVLHVFLPVPGRPDEFPGRDCLHVRCQGHSCQGEKAHTLRVWFRGTVYGVARSGQMFPTFEIERSQVDCGSSARDPAGRVVRSSSTMPNKVNLHPTVRATPGAAFVLHGLLAPFFSSKHRGEERTQVSGGALGVRNFKPVTS